MTDELLDAAIIALEAREFQNDDSISINVLNMTRSFGDDLEIRVWARHWSDLLVQICNPDDYEARCGIASMVDIDAFTETIDALIIALTMVAKFKKAKTV